MTTIPRITAAEVPPYLRSHPGRRVAVVAETLDVGRDALLELADREWVPCRVDVNGPRRVAVMIGSQMHPVSRAVLMPLNDPNAWRGHRFDRLLIVGDVERVENALANHAYLREGIEPAFATVAPDAPVADVRREKVARALCASGASLIGHGDFDHLGYLLKQRYYAQADAVLAELNDELVEVEHLRGLLAGVVNIIEALKNLVFDRHALYAQAVKAGQIPADSPELIRLDEVLAVLLAGVSVALDEPPEVSRDR